MSLCSPKQAQKSGYYHYKHYPRYHHPYNHYEEEAQKGNIYILEPNVEILKYKNF